MQPRFAFQKNDELSSADYDHYTSTLLPLYTYTFVIVSIHIIPLDMCTRFNQFTHTACTDLDSQGQL